uniref:Ankyrin repeat domain-containing protein 54 n=1 Tax=Trichogramma kaykai TaxID=54128 RepID=A0ABD2XBX9_9HYME
MEPAATYLSVLQKYKNNLKSITNDIDRREEYFRLYKKEFMWLGNDYACIALNHLINDKDLFPSVEDKKYFLKNSLNRSSAGRLIIKQLHTSTFNIHEVKFEDGKSALHCLDEIYGSSELLWPKFETRNIIEYFFRNNLNENYSDGHGYTYLHGACMAGQLHSVARFLEQGVDANLDTYTCSPLHIAARYRREAIVKILLKHKANPNKPDREQSTPLHALAYPCLCDCVCAWNFCHKRGPVVEIVKMLIDHGANIEARNCHGDTPLQSAVSRFDTELTRTLLKHGADLDSLNEDRMFSANFSSLELKCYPLTLDIIEVIKLLQSAGYEMNFLTKLKMIKFWIKARGNNIDRMVGEDTGDNAQRDLGHLPKLTLI